MEDPGSATINVVYPKNQEKEETSPNRNHIRVIDSRIKESDMSVKYGQKILSQGPLVWHHEALPSDAKQ